MEDIRLDKYLWAVRVFKTRSDAADAIRTNKVTVNGAYAKPSREVKIGDLIAVRKQQVTYSYKVLDLVSSRQPAKNVPLYCLDVTPQEERDKLNIPRETVFVFRERGPGLFECGAHEPLVSAYLRKSTMSFHTFIFSPLPDLPRPLSMS